MIEPSTWTVEYRVHESQRRDNDWIRMAAKDRADGHDLLERFRAGGVVIEARLLQVTPVVIEEWTVAAGDSR